MKFQKLTAGLLALSMLSTPSAGVVQMLTAVAEETAPTSGTCGENVTWEFDKSTGTLTISGTGMMRAYYATSPWYEGDFIEDIQNVVIEDGVTSIGNGAFLYCDSLTSVTIPDSVMSIGGDAFGGCTSLTAVTIPDSVTSIGEWAFYKCGSLIDITIPDSVTYIGGNAFSETPWLTAKQEENPLVFVNGIPIDGTTCSGDVIIPDDVTNIGEAVFNNCESLTSVTIPVSVTSIGDSAFYCCTSLTDITILNPDCEIFDAPSTISNGYDEDYNYFFTGTIHGYANSTAQAYAEKYGYTFESLGDAPDTPDAPTSGTCGVNVTWKFDESTGTLTISGTGAMEDYMQEVRPSWYSNNLEISSVIIEDGVTSIGDYAFEGTESLTSVTIPDSVEYIGYEVFGDCTSLTSVTIPNSVTSIGGWAFSFCDSLTDITIPDSVTYIGSGAFFETPWLAAKQEENSFVVVNRILIDGKACSGEVTIPDGVKIVGGGAFSFCTSLTSVTIPDSVTSIDALAFYQCTSLTDITILNPDCEIFDTSSTIHNGWNEDYNDIFTTTIHGYANSTAQSYAEKYDRKFETLGDTPDAPAVLLGDVSGNGEIDASDATDLLIALAKLGAGEDSGLTADQQKAADTNGDGELDAGDATVILQYAAYLGSGGTGTLADFLNQ